MKKIILVLLMLFAALLGGCKEKAEIPAAMPTDLLSADEVKSAVGDENNYTLDGGAIIDMGGGTYKAVYLTDPIGAGDSVTIELTQPQENVSVKDKYQKNYDARTQKKKVQGLGESAYVAFPSVHIIEKGYLIDISAGSGDTEKQLELLVRLGKTACEKLDLYLSGDENQN